MKKSSKAHTSNHKSNKVWSTKRLVAYPVIIFVAFILIALSAYTISSLVVNYQGNQRQSKIEDVYSSLNLDDSYRSESSNILREKVVYEWDASRSYSSVMTFGRNAGREETFQDLKSKIEAAGFEQIEGPGYGDIARQDHYKNSAGQYIRVTVETRAMYDSILYGTDYPEATSEAALETGPVHVTIKVNLDDNNE
jgi:hypothetical protein